MNDFYVGVPFSHCDKYIPKDSIVATREDEAIGIAVGAWFAGKNPLVYMQNSGFGNCIDIMTSLIKSYGIEIDILINQRFRPEHHKLMGEIIPKLIYLLEYEKIKYCSGDNE